MKGARTGNSLGQRNGQQLEEVRSKKAFFKMRQTAAYGNDPGERGEMVMQEGEGGAGATS